MRFSADKAGAEELSRRLLAFAEFSEFDRRARDLAPGIGRGSHLDGACDEAVEQVLRHEGFPARASGEQPTRLGRLRTALLAPFGRTPS